MRTLLFFLTLIVVLVALFLPSCRHELVLPVTDDPQDTVPPPPPPPVDTGDYTGVPCSPDTVYFQNQVLPLVVSQCAKSGCHDAISHKEGVILTDYTRVMTIVKAFKPSNSKLYTVLSKTGDERMPPPPDPAFTTDQKNLIKKWIEQGALNNQCNENYGSCSTDNVTYANFINPLMANQCTGCHGGVNPSGSLKLTTYDEVKASAQSGKLYGSVTHSAGFVAMPQGAPALSPCFTKKIKAWIDAGMPQ